MISSIHDGRYFSTKGIVDISNGYDVQYLYSYILNKYIRLSQLGLNEN